MNEDLNGKLVLVTGASSGIGRATSILLSEFGVRVLLMGRSIEKLREVRSLLNGEGHCVYELDLCYTDKINDFVKSNFSHLKIDGIVNCAGVSPTLPFLYSTPSKLEQTLALNVLAPYELTRTVIKYSYDSQMNVVFIASVMGMVGEKAKSMYSLSKGALISLTKSLAVELSEKNIRVNAISPAVVDTPLIQKSEYYKTETALQKIVDKHLLGIGVDVDIAKSVLFLISNQSRWITGQNMVVDGGYTAK